MEREGQRYARHLFLHGHGYALWIPEPNDNSTPEYFDQGVRVGDVGIITNDGGFDYLFNICAPADDPINRTHGVPCDFTPLIWNEEIFSTPGRFRSGVPTCSRRAKQRQLSFEASAAVLGSPVGIGGGLEISFQEDSGAVLMPPNGALRVDCVQLAVFRSYAEKNAHHWYQFVNGDRGREAENGSLYLVTGFDKTDAWETALFDSSSSSHSCTLVFTTGGVADGRMKLLQSSMLQPCVTSRCSGGDTKHNQALFVRGFRVSLRQGLSAWAHGGTRIASTYSSSQKDILGPMGRIKLNGSQPDSPPSSGNNNGDGDSWCEKGSQSTEGASSDTSIEDDDLDFFTSKPYHPLIVINDHILQSKHEVNVVVTHDNVWIALLSDEDTDMPDDQTLIRRFEEKYDVTAPNGIALVNYKEDLDKAKEATFPDSYWEGTLGNLEESSMSPSIDDGLIVSTDLSMKRSAASGLIGYEECNGNTFSLSRKMTPNRDTTVHGAELPALPSLPKINSKEIERQILTHRSVYARPTHTFEDLPNDPSPDNEKFEHLGDSVLSLVVTDLLFEMYPGLRVGPSTKVRAMIVNNQILAAISQRYKLPHRLSVHPTQALALRESIHVQADVFEAFVGGLYTDQGLEAVRPWLNALFRPYVKTAYDIVRAQYGPGLLIVSPSQSNSSSLSWPSSSPTSPPHIDSDSNDPAPATAAMNTQGLAGHLVLFNKWVAKLNKQVEWVPLPIEDAQYPVKVMPTASASPPSEVWKLTNLTPMKSIPVWRIKVVVDGETYGEGKGMTKKAAKNEAAKMALAKLVVYRFTVLLFYA
uniref:Uncharacterized protein n=1 Tax=Moniliophthora roreri TaxID=221103 RepID=A0A0W0FX36_MONRR